jgi:hypothetical protein
MSQAPRPAQRRGRPPLPDPDDVKRYAVGFRTTRSLKERIERAAQASGHSVAEELEWRLERSFIVQNQTETLKALVIPELTILEEGLASLESRLGALALFQDQMGFLHERVTGLVEFAKLMATGSTRPPKDE